MKKPIIPIFFASDDNYIPLMSVAITSMIKNASKDYDYQIIVLNANNISENNKKIIRGIVSGNFTIDFYDISEYIAPYVTDLSLRLRDYYSLAIYYRIFIPTLFPQFDKVIYLDGDLVVPGDISRLYNVDLQGNLIAGIRDQLVCNHQEFIDYIQNGVGVPATEYFNSGVIVMDTKKFREQNIEKQIVDMVKTYNFDTCCPDQDHLNVVCRNSKLLIDTKYNKMPIFEEGFDNNDIIIIHYNSFEKPWHRDNVLYEDHFWNFAKQSPFYSQLRALKDSMTAEKIAEIDQSAMRLLKHGARIGREETHTFKKVLKL